MTGKTDLEGRPDGPYAQSSSRQDMESQAWWCRPPIPALGRLRQKGHEFEWG